MDFKILIAEDDTIAARVLSNSLYRAGFNVDVVGDGSAAYARMQEHPYPVLITDWMMPRMDGIELVERVRDEPGPQPRIVMLTVMASEAALERAREAGADAVLTKPVHAETIIGLIQALLRAPSEHEGTTVQAG